MDMADNIEDVVCEDHIHCAHCRQLLLGWKCVRVQGTFFCDIACAVEHDEEVDGELDDLEH